MLTNITNQAKQVVTELLDQAGLCTRTAAGHRLLLQRDGRAAHRQSLQHGGAQAALNGVMPVLEHRGIRLAAQCCEHLNRALIVEKETALALALDMVNVVPQPNAGGAFATAVYHRMKHL